jgi:hypothetical protein
MSKSKVLEPGALAERAVFDAVLKQVERMSRVNEGLSYRRVLSALDVVHQHGLLGPGLEKDTRIGGRVTHQLLEAAKARSGLTSNTELLEYALAKVALEDDFGEFLVSQKSTVDPELDLEF